MSRRRDFDTSLSGPSGAPKNGGRQNNGHANGTGSSGPSSGAAFGGARSAAKKQGQPPRVTPPDPTISAPSVPTESAVINAENLAEDASTPTPLTPAEGEAELCFICAEPVTFYSVGICGHKTCHVCAMRLRTFYKKFECTFCKTPTPSLLFSRSPDAHFPTEHHKPSSAPAVIQAARDGADKLPKGERWDRGLTLPGTLILSAFQHADDKLNVVFEDEAMMEETLLLLRFNCPYDGCAHMGHDWPSLEKHTLAVHGLVLCTLCRRQLSRFAHEQVLYPPHLLALHDPSRVLRGQQPPRPRGDEMELVKTWEASHPMCDFCHESYFGPDELHRHMRDKHEECFVCRQQGEKDLYFRNYGQLEQHFNSAHYACPQPVCLEKKFVVFATEVDLRAHMMEEHSEQMSARDRASMRQLPVEFQSAERRRGDNRRGDRERDRERERPTPSLRRDGAPHQQQISQPPPMAPAQAAQARRAAQVDRQEEREEMSRRRRGFDTGLTGSSGSGSGSGSRANGAHERRGQTSAPARIEMAAASGGASGFATPREDVDDVAASRHAALLSRIALLVQGNDNKMTSFRSAVRQFKNNESSARDMVDTIFNVLEREVESTLGVLREVATLFEDEEKGRAVLEAMNTFRVEQRDQFPALAPSGLGSNYAGITSGAILNAKRSTQTHRRGSTSQNVWDRVEAAAANQPVNRPTTGVNGRAVPGATSSGHPNSTFARAGGSRAGLNAGAFPSLGSASAGGSAGAGGKSSTPWSTSSGASRAPSALTHVVSHAPAAPRSENFSVPAPRKQNLSAGGFPTLPSSSAAQQARDERKALFSKPNAREESIRRITGQAARPPPPVVASGGGGWGGAGGGANGGVESAMEGLELDEAGSGAGGGSGGGGKKKGKGKQLLFSVSARPT